MPINECRTIGANVAFRPANEVLLKKPKELIADSTLSGTFYIAQFLRWLRR